MSNRIAWTLGSITTMALHIVRIYVIMSDIEAPSLQNYYYSFSAYHENFINQSTAKLCL